MSLKKWLGHVEYVQMAHKKERNVISILNPNSIDKVVSLDVGNSVSDTHGDWKNWLILLDKTKRDMKDGVDIGKTFGLKFNGDNANMFNVIFRGGNNGISGGGVHVESICEGNGEGVK